MQTINTNLFSENAQRQLLKTNNALQTSMQRLSSGLRINSAKDDAAGLQIANRMSAQIGGMSVAIRNANDGISLGQTAEGALEEVTNLLLRMRDLAVQGANGTNADSDYTALDAEYQQLIEEIDRVYTATTYNGESLFDAGGGDSGAFAIAVNPTDGSAITFTFTDITSTGTSSGDVGDLANSVVEIGAIDTVLGVVDGERAKLGAFQNRLESAINSLANSRENLSASRSRIMDTDFASETASLTKYQVMQQAGTAVLAQANAMPQSVLKLLSY